MNSVWVCQQQSQTSHWRPPDCDYEPESTSSSCLSMDLQLEHPEECPSHICIHHSALQHPPERFMLGVGLEASPLWRLLHMVDSAEVKLPLSLAVTEPREFTAHTDPSGKGQAAGCSNCLNFFFFWNINGDVRADNYLVGGGCGCKLGMTTNSQEKNRANWNVTGQGLHYGSVQLLRVLWVKCWLGVRLGEQKKEIVQMVSLRNIVFKTREAKPFIVCTHLLGMGPDKLLEKGKGKQHKKQAT